MLLISKIPDNDPCSLPQKFLKMIHAPYLKNGPCIDQLILNLEKSPYSALPDPECPLHRSLSSFEKVLAIGLKLNDLIPSLYD